MNTQIKATRLKDYCERAREVEGIVVRVPVAGGELGLLYQRPRKRNGRLEEGAIEPMCYRFEYLADGDPPDNLTPTEAQMLLDGMGIEDVRDLRAIKAAGIFEQIARNHQPYLFALDGTWRAQ